MNFKFLFFAFFAFVFFACQKDIFPPTQTEKADYQLKPISVCDYDYHTSAGVVSPVFSCDFLPGDILEFTIVRPNGKEGTVRIVADSVGTCFSFPLRFAELVKIYCKLKSGEGTRTLELIRNNFNQACVNTIGNTKKLLIFNNKFAPYKGTDSFFVSKRALKPAFCYYVNAVKDTADGYVIANCTWEYQNGQTDVQSVVLCSPSFPTGPIPTMSFYTYPTDTTCVDFRIEYDYSGVLMGVSQGYLSCFDHSGAPVWGTQTPVVQKTYGKIYFDPMKTFSTSPFWSKQ